jgi:hypothetical protein
MYARSSLELTYSHLIIDIFERKSKYGISLWEAKNDEIRGYIRRFINNSRPLILNVSIGCGQEDSLSDITNRQGIIKSVILATYDKSGRVIDHIFFNPRFLQSLVVPSETGETLLLFEEQLRSMILRLLQVDQKLAKYDPGTSIRSFPPTSPNMQSLLV